MKHPQQTQQSENSHNPGRRDKSPRIAARALALIAALAAAQIAGAASYTWNVASGNWSTPANWTPATSSPTGPLATDFVIFGNAAESSTDSNSPNNIVDAGFAGTIANLTYDSVAVAPFVYDVTQIPAGQTLMVTNDVLVGGLNEGAGPNLTYGLLTGGGTFMVTATNLAVENYGTAAGANTYANFDLSGLTNFIYNNARGTISIADTTLPQTSGSHNVRAGGNFSLAGGSNWITASNINLATCSAPQAGPTSTLFLGAGTNIINVTTFNIANNKNPANVVFATATGGLKIRGTSGGTSRATIIIGNRNVSGGTGTTPGQMRLNGHPVDIMANSLVVGEVSVTGGPSGSGAGGQFGNGTFQFDTGTVDATNVVMATDMGPNNNGGFSGSYSSLTVGSAATLRVGTGGISLLNQTASNICSSVLTIASNGTVVCNGNITVVTNAADGTGAASETNIINIVGSGNLTLGAGNVAGTTNSPISQFILDTNSTLQFVAPLTTQPSIAADTLVWPADDSALTFVVSNLSATTTVGTTIPLVSFNIMTGGAFTSPAVMLPSGVTGTLSLSGNTIILTITSSVYPSLSIITPSLTTLCTNTALTTVASSTASTITNVQVITTTTTLGALTSTTTTNSLSASGLTVTGIGTSTADISFTLAPNTIYSSVTVKATDANGVTVSLGTSRFDTISPALVIEAADFNYQNGLFIDTPADGGLALYANLVGTEGIDEHKAPRTGAQSYYRPGDAVIIQNANPSLGIPPAPTEQKFVTAAANGDSVNVEQEVGFNTPGDWLNYTRTFGSGGSAPAGTYNVWCYLATSGSGVQASFSQLTSDPTQGSQTTNFLGTFGTAAFSDNGYNNFVYVPLVDQFGNRAAITIGSGQQTFKSTVVGNPNLAFYVLVPVAPVLTPQLLHVYPDGSAPGQATNRISFAVGPAQGAAISTNDIHLILNGIDVSSGLSFSQAGGVWTATLTIPANELYTAVINVTNLNGLSTTYSNSFDTFDLNSYQWEAVDYDFSTNNGAGWVSGLFIDNPAPTGDTNAPYSLVAPIFATNSYNAYPMGFTPGSDPYGQGAVAQEGIDIHYTNAPGLQSAYRADTVGSQIASDFLRPKFLAAQTNFSDPAICEFNVGWFNAGFWLNYTRTYPTNNYNVWARLAGGAGAFSGTTLSLVTSGVGTPNQTTNILGSFADPTPAGWQTYHWIPLLDANGNKVVIALGGKATLRLTSGNNVNPQSFMLTTATSPAQFTVSANLVGDQIQISIPTQFGYNYTLWSASSLDGSGWTTVGSALAGNGSVETVTPPVSGNQGFYRVTAQPR